MPSPRLTLDEFTAIVRQELDRLPAEFHPLLENLLIDVEPWPSRGLLRDMGFDPLDRDGLLGVFIGRGFPEWEPAEQPLNRIILFQRPLERASRDQRQLAAEIRHTLLHELAHHFGFSEEQLDWFEARDHADNGTAHDGNNDE